MKIIVLRSIWSRESFYFNSREFFLFFFLLFFEMNLDRVTSEKVEDSFFLKIQEIQTRVKIFFTTKSSNILKIEALKMFF